MRTSGSLRRRLIGWLVAAMLGIGGLALLDTRAEAVRTARDVSDRVLAGAALAIAERVTVTARGGAEVAIPFSALDMLSSAAQDVVYYRVDGPTGTLTGYADLPEAALPPGEDIGFADLAYLGTALRAATVTRRLTTAEGVLDVRVTVAESTLAREGLARAILARSAARLGLLIAAAALVAWAGATLALRPLDRLGRQIARRAPSDLMPIAEPAPRELVGLVEATNGFMRRLDHAIAALRRFAGSANHQIRTPLTVARTQLELARRSRGAAAAGAMEKADAALVRAERVLAQLLLLARIEAEGRQPGLVSVDLAALSRQITTEALPEALKSGHDLGFDGPSTLWVRAEPVLLAEALRNLIHNALVHTPAGTEVTLAIGTEGGQALVRLSDSGPALGARALDTLRARLDRGRPADPVPVEAHGLGLLIVRDIVAALGGRIAAAPGPGGRGLTISLHLPLSSPGAEPPAETGSH